jgi:tRNA nucleotidyltransferase (CCA-adding enzyme)
VYAAPDVTLEDDLRRRDLTINAVAKAEDGTLIDPFGGKKDLEKKVLRHVSESFQEDPVRILRVARFAARFDFSIDKSTLDLMRSMVQSGEADYLVPERVWQEFAKGLMEEHPELMFEVLEACGLRERLLPELETQPEVLAGSLAVRFALLCWSLAEDEVETLCRRLRAPNDVRDLALLVSRNRNSLENARRPEELLELLKKTDALRRPERFAELLEVVRLAAHGADLARLERARAAAAAVDAGAIAAKASAADIPRLIDEARLQAIKAAA